MISILGLAFSAHAFGVSVALLTLAAFAYIAIRGVFVFRK